MRFAAGCFVSALALVGGDALGLFGSWALPTGAVALLFASVLAAVVMDDEPSSVEGLVVAAPREPSAAKSSTAPAMPSREAA